MFSKLLRTNMLGAIGAMLFMYRPASAMQTQLSSSEIPHSKLSAYRPNDYLHMHFAVEAYENDGGKLKENWELFSKHEADNGYFGVAYRNTEQKHIIIAHRGTEPSISIEGIKDFFSDYDLVTRNLNSQEASAWYDFAVRVIEENREDYTYSFTGHSLGGWLAQVCLWKYQDEFVRNKGYQDGFAVTMDEPGAKELLEALQPRVATNRRIKVDELDITNYLSYPNGVNTGMGHIGTVYALFPNLNLSLLDKYFFTYTKKAHSAEQLLLEFSEETGLPKQCVRVLDWPRVVWNLNMPSAIISMGPMGYLGLAIKVLKAGHEYLGFYTYSKDVVNTPETLPSADRFELLHGIHYRVESFNNKVLPLANMPRALRRFLQELSMHEDRAIFINDLIPNAVDEELGLLLDNYHIYEQEVVLKETITTKANALLFRDKVTHLLSVHSKLKGSLAVLQGAYLRGLIQKGQVSSIMAELNLQVQNTQNVLKSLSLKQGMARLYKFIKPTWQEVEPLEDEYNALLAQITSLKLCGLTLQGSVIADEAKKQIEEILHTQIGQLELAKQITSALLLYMQDNHENADKELNILIANLEKNPLLQNVDKSLFLNRAYNLKAKIAAQHSGKEQKELSGEYYKKAIKYLPHDAITRSNYGGLLTDRGRAEKNASLHVEAYDCYQEVSHCLEQIRPGHQVIVTSGMAYGLIMLAQNIQQGQIDKATLLKLPSIAELYNQAEDLIKRTIAINPTYLNTRLYSALLAYEQENYVQALQEINNALAMQPTHVTGLMRKGFILEKLGKNEEALKLLAIAKDRLEKSQKNGENSEWIEEIDERINQIQTCNAPRPFAKL